MIVNEWPKSIATEAGIICNPTPQQCIDAGYELYVPPSAEEIASIEAQRAQEEAERVAMVEGLRKDYREAVAQFCGLAGLPVVTKLEDATAIETAINQANAQENFKLSLGLTQIALRLEHLIGELRRKDGDDAWLRI